MKWLIKNPAPMDSRLKKWGDYHFGRSLTKYLERLGHEVETQYDPGWDQDLECDVVLVLRGKYPFPRSGLHRGALRVMWNISHPADVPREEYDSYDLVLVASNTWAARLRPQVTAPVHAMLQCTDPEEFDDLPGSSGTDRQGFIFVGNTREVERSAVLWAIGYGLPLRIWGRGWAKWGAEGYVEGDYLPNEELGRLYARSRVTLNDHWEDMKESGFVNNRIFDALATGLPVISDWHEELEALVPEGIMFYRNREEFDRCVETALLAYPQVQAAAATATAQVRRDFSFERRARDMSDLVTSLRDAGRPREPVVP